MGEVLVQLKETSFPQQVDGFPAGAKRSVKGALHFRPGSATWITDDEFRFILDQRPDTARNLRVLSKKLADVPTSKSEPEPAAPPDLSEDPEPKAVEPTPEEARPRSRRRRSNREKED